MIKISKWISGNNLKSKMIMQVHDELVFDVEKDELDLFKTTVKTLMEDVINHFKQKMLMVIFLYHLPIIPSSLQNIIKHYWFVWLAMPHRYHFF